MKENEYILLTNRILLAKARNLLYGVLAGEEYGISERELCTIKEILKKVVNRLWEIELVDGEESERREE